MEKFVHFIFLISLSETYVSEETVVVNGVEGKSISINCTYNPKENQWREKSWCKHISKTECQYIVSARRFWMQFLKKRNGTTSISDNIQEGILTVTINPLKLQDAGLYQCKTDFLGTKNTLCKVEVNVLPAGIWETEAEEEPRVIHSISRPSDVGINLYFLLAGFLGCKLLVATLILIIVKSKMNRTEDENRRENEHQLFPIAA
ncbi:triggering receptor expressed on myeloid cells 2-like isoform X2 [Tiliqua scincoides]|uniref:triggering receptor expressed on myeloid cells 2-like isoform X2 n=1 Tax=Tiliqua scincoides TaxID=71010 RepID=UPI003461F8C6